MPCAFSRKATSHCRRQRARGTGHWTAAGCDRQNWTHELPQARVSLAYSAKGPDFWLHLQRWSDLWDVSHDLTQRSRIRSCQAAQRSGVTLAAELLALRASSRCAQWCSLGRVRWIGSVAVVRITPLAYERHGWTDSLKTERIVADNASDAVEPGCVAAAAASLRASGDKLCVRSHPGRDRAGARPRVGASSPLPASSKPVDCAHTLGAFPGHNSQSGCAEPKRRKRHPRVTRKISPVAKPRPG